MEIGNYEIPIQIVVEAVNRSSGRPHPIVESEKCVACGLEFISSIQDVNLRKNQGYDSHCYLCKQKQNRVKRANNEKIRRANRKKTPSTEQLQ